MNEASQKYFLDVIAGRRRGAASAAVRSALQAAVPAYAAAVRMRNICYDRGVLRSWSLSRPTLSVGNLTVGGTGKTPIVCWLASALRAAGRKPAVLLRGYKSTDEQTLISQLTQVTVVADPDRRRGATAALAKDPDIDLFILDDALQHRRVRRDVNIALINAAQPWGHGHLLPRGLLREPISGLRRADAVVLTHAGRASLEQLIEIETVLRRSNSDAPIFLTDHELIGLLTPNGQRPMTELAQRPYFVAAAIGQPENFLADLQSHGMNCVGHWFWPDHHSFTSNDVIGLRRQAAGAEAIVVTEKDWTKLSALSGIEEGIPFWRAQLRIRFRNAGEKRLLDWIGRRIAS